MFLYHNKGKIGHIGEKDFPDDWHEWPISLIYPTLGNKDRLVKAEQIIAYRTPVAVVNNKTEKSINVDGFPGDSVENLKSDRYHQIIFRNEQELLKFLGKECASLSSTLAFLRQERARGNSIETLLN